MADIDAILEAKRDGRALTDAQVDGFVAGVVDGSVTRAQAAALLAFIYTRGMTDHETVALTRAMAASGEQLSWHGLAGPLVDKHSTGGVGDKVSLVLAPLWAELGACVPMISGRGLGHTGGTLDKLESIPGFRTALQPGVLRTVLGEVGCFICGQTSALAPADRTLYALRNETCTVPSIPLITASILSKKLAEGIDELVLDVKFGSGAFMGDRDAASRLAESLVRVGEGSGLRCRARLTDMNQPLGHTVGNALEVEEAIACLQGRGPDDLATLVCELIGHPDARAVLDSGAAWPRFERMVRAQGGDLSAPLLGADVVEEPMVAERAGTVTRCDAYGVARAAFVLGAGRVRADQDIHPGVGVRIHHKVGARVEAGEPLATLVHAGRGLTASRALLRGALVVG